MRLCCALIALAGLAGTAWAADKGPIQIAVTELKAEGVEASSARVITDRLRSELLRTGAFSVIERGQMDEVLKEQGFQQSGCVSDQCVVEVGQLLGVSHIVAGSVGRVGKVFTLSARLVNVSSGAIVLDVSVDCECAIEDVLQKSCAELARKLAAAAPGGPVLQPVAPVKTKNKRRQWARRIVFGVAAAGLLAGGIIANNSMKSSVAECNDSHDQYLRDPSSYSSLSVPYKSSWEAAHRSMVVRNILYAGSGVFAVAFVISIPF